MSEKTVQGRFWTGPIVSREQAVRITNVAGWVYLIVAVMILLSSLIGGGPEPASSPIGGALFLGVPAAFLLGLQSRVAAVVLLVLTSLLTLIFIISLIALFAAGGGIFVGLVPIVLWLALTWLSMRATTAAFGLRKLPENIAAAFD